MPPSGWPACGTRSSRSSWRSRVDPELAAQRRQALAAAGGSLPPGPPEAIAAYLAAEQRLGRVRADVDPREAAVVILAALFGLVAGQATGDAGLDDERVASAVRLLVRGIQPPPSEP